MSIRLWNNKLISLFGDAMFQRDTIVSLCETCGQVVSNQNMHDSLHFNPVSLYRGDCIRNLSISLMGPRCEPALYEWSTTWVGTMGMLAREMSLH